MRQKFQLQGANKWAWHAGTRVAWPEIGDATSDRSINQTILRGAGRKKKNGQGGAGQDAVISCHVAGATCAAHLSLPATPPVRPLVHQLTRHTQRHLLWFICVKMIGCTSYLQAPSYEYTPPHIQHSVSSIPYPTFSILQRASVSSAVPATVASS